MQIHFIQHSLPVFKNAVLTVGSFDGVHLGHQKILAQLKEEAAKISGETVLLTFNTHPRLLLMNRDSGIKLLNTWEEKIKLLSAQGLDHLVVVDFNPAFASLEPEQYIKEVLVDKIKPAIIIIGYDHKFGRERKGDIHLLKAMSEAHQYKMQEISEEVLHDITISSTKIRKALLAGEVAFASDLLGYHYGLQGKVVKGKQLGRTIGYPTANIELLDRNKLVPSHGVYAVNVHIPSLNLQLKGMLNIGNNPTVNALSTTIEVNIFDFAKDIYDEKIKISFIKKMRDVIKFDGLESLKSQLANDEMNARKILSEGDIS
jgi:riboflavin kinase/FMN adenylyltransferase